MQMHLQELGAKVRFVCPSEWQGEFEAFHEFDEVIEDSDVLHAATCST